MASHAVIVCDLFLPFGGLKRNWKALVKRESFAVVKPVNGLCCPLAYKIMRCMAVVTDGNMCVSTPRPPLINLIHRVAVFTGLRRITHIRKPFGIDKSEYGGAYKPTDQKQKRHDSSYPSVF